MAYGTVKVDNITFTNGGIDQTVTVSGIVQSISGNITATGTIQAATIIGTSTVSGATVTGNAGVFTTVTGGSAGFTTVTGTTVTGTTVNFNTGTFTSQVSGATVTGNLAQFTTLTGGTAGFTTITGATVTGTTANFATVSGTTVTGNAGQFTTITGTSAGFTTITGATVTGTVGNFGSGSAAAPSVSVGTTDNGIYSPGADQVAISTNSLQRLAIDANGNINIDSGGVYYDAVNNRLAVGTTGPEGNFHVLNNSAGTVTPSANGNLGVFEDGLSNGISILTPDGSTGSIFFGSPTSNRYAEVTASYTSGLMSVGTRKTGGELRFVSSNAAEAARIDSDGRLLVGTSSARTNLFGGSRSAGIQLESTGVSDSKRFISLTSNTNSTLGSSILTFARTRGTALGDNTLLNNNDEVGRVDFQGADGTNFIRAASVEVFIDGTPGANDMPGRLVFSVTADGASSPTEALRISNNRAITVSDGGNVVLGTTTGTKIGTATTQKLGFYNATPVVQPAAVADATDAATVITQLNALLAKLRTLGIIAT